ncbi:hypothetical protein EPH_0064520 [Eimeria praecox]|uniref:Uncharacterized protein n=1 Tax=Eimeria praecox TaxID=51316 RepID=U6GZI6_9EIME|nr:hypothetical protein EPH_0064520 [Eimeria praecox]
MLQQQMLHQQMLQQDMLQQEKLRLYSQSDRLATLAGRAVEQHEQQQEMLQQQKLQQQMLQQEMLQQEMLQQQMLQQEMLQQQMLQQEMLQQEKQQQEKQQQETLGPPPVQLVSPSSQALYPLESGGVAASCFLLFLSLSFRFYHSNRLSSANIEDLLTHTSTTRSTKKEASCCFFL